LAIANCGLLLCVDKNFNVIHKSKVGNAHPTGLASLKPWSSIFSNPYESSDPEKFYPQL
jgi:hypothetical protein